MAAEEDEAVDLTTMLFLGQDLDTDKPCWKGYALADLGVNQEVVVDDYAQVHGTTFFLVAGKIYPIMYQAPGWLWNHSHHASKKKAALDLDGTVVSIHSAGNRLLAVTADGKGIVFEHEGGDKFSTGKLLDMPDAVNIFGLGANRVFGFATGELQDGSVESLVRVRAVDGAEVGADWGKLTFHKNRQTVTFAHGSDACLFMAGDDIYKSDTAYMLKTEKNVCDLIKIGKFTTGTVVSVAANSTHLYVLTKEVLAYLKLADLDLKGGHKKWTFWKDLPTKLTKIVAAEGFALGYASEQKVVYSIRHDGDRLDFRPFHWDVLESIVGVDTSVGGYGCMVATAEEQVAKSLKGKPIGASKDAGFATKEKESTAPAAEGVD
jgi:hypothetical protein